jgi:hypothetical protein
VGPAGAPAVIPTSLRVSSIDIGNRWRISDEGPALVFRDTLSGGDQRVAMYQGRYRDI